MHFLRIHLMFYWNQVYLRGIFWKFCKLLPGHNGDKLQYSMIIVHAKQILSIIFYIYFYEWCASSEKILFKIYCSLANSRDFLQEKFHELYNCCVVMNCSLFFQIASISGVFRRLFSLSNDNSQIRKCCIFMFKVFKSCTEKLTHNLLAHIYY